MTSPTRRSFLKLSGFSMLAACSRGLDQKAIPLLVPHEERVPGRAVWYATGCSGCAAGCGVLARSRDGRPVKLEGNPAHPLSKGGLCATGQASVLSLYDSHRLHGPRSRGEAVDWKRVDAEVRAGIEAARGSGTAVRFLTGTIHSPTVLAAIRSFGARFGNFQHVQYDALSSSAQLDVYEKMLGTRALPRPRFDRADVIVGFDADFLATWISPVEYTRDYRAGRSLEEDGRHSYHVQFEARVSLTGANADRRFVRSPDGLRDAISELAVAVARRTGASIPLTATPKPEIKELAARLTAADRGTTLIVCGLDDADAQKTVAWINTQLGNYETTLETGRLSHQSQGSDTDLLALQREIRAGAVGLLFVAQCNPTYDRPGLLDLTKVNTVVSFAGHDDETASKAQFVCPDHHPLESWGDAEAVDGIVTVSQPLVAPLFQTRALVDSLNIWTGGTDGDASSAYDLMRATWKQALLPRAGAGAGSFDTFWAKAVHDGFAKLKPATVRVKPPAASTLRASAREPGTEGLALVLYAKTGMLDGRHANNPWLHELPDPVTKIVWDNYACLSATAASRLDVKEGDLVDAGGVKLPVHIQPGQHDDVVAIALGYGRKGTDRFAHVGPDWLEGDPTVEDGEFVGKNAAVLRGKARVAVKTANGRRVLACTQPYQSLTVPEELGGDKRPMVHETTLKEHRRPSASPEEAHGSHGGSVDLWPDDHRFKGHHWALTADLSACTGCSACVIGCQAENNVPVVGKDEVARAREMHWIRIDRYRDDGDVAHQPVMCQQCDNAPCETVCPVLATVQSSEGLNQQVYNRCVGTRYCANNCPYKVRRFNWFDYPHDDRLANASLNPDVVVRSRGIMEKCSFCVQRITEAKAEAKREGRPLRDGDISPACVQSCPADALVFGDRNDPDSAVSKAWTDRRQYRLLEELNTKPSVGYLSLVRNRDV